MIKMNSIVKVDAKDFGLEENKATQIAQMFDPMLNRMVELEKELFIILDKEYNFSDQRYTGCVNYIYNFITDYLGDNN